MSSTVGSQIFRRYATYAVVALVDGPARAAARRRARQAGPTRGTVRHAPTSASRGATTPAGR